MRDHEWWAKVAVAAAVISVYVAIAAGGTFADPDMYHEMSLAREWVKTGDFPHDDVFAFTPTKSPTVHHEWGWGVVLYGALGAFGPGALVLLRAALGSLVFFGVWRLARRRGASNGALAASAIPLIIVGLSVSFVTLRAQGVTLVLFVLQLGLLERDRSGGRRWILPWLAVHLLWLNLHAGFVIGIVALGAYAGERLLAREPIRHLVLVAVASLGLVAVNPWGLDYYAYLAGALTMDRSMITEWAPIQDHWPPFVAVFLLSLVVAVLALRGVGSRRGWLLLALLAVAAVLQLRHLSLYAVVWMVTVPCWLEGSRGVAWIREVFVRRALPIAFLGVVIGLGFSSAAVSFRPWSLRVVANPRTPKGLVFPVGVADYLHEAGFEGRLVVPFVYGAYMTWRLYPEVLVSIDGRFEVAYNPALLAEHGAFFAGKDDWRRLIDEHPPDAIAIPRWMAAVQRLVDDESWKQVYEDDAFVLFAPVNTGLPVIDRRGTRLSESFPGEEE